MGSNRDLINRANETNLVSTPSILDTGIPVLGFRSRLIVDEGWCAVITAGGKFKEVLEPGEYALSRFGIWKEVKVLFVDMRIKSLSFSTTREFRVTQPLPIEINLDLSIEYQVVDPRRVALELSAPLTILWDRVYNAARGAVESATLNEVRSGGESIAQEVLRRLQEMRLSKTIGLEVLHVLVTSIKPTDPGIDAIARLQYELFTLIEKWKAQAAINSVTQITIPWLIQTGSPLVSQILEISTKYDMAPEELLRRLLGSAQASLPETSDSSYVIGRPTQDFLSRDWTVTRPMEQQDSLSNLEIADVHARIREEISYLETIPGAQVKVKPGTDTRNIPDGSYDIKMDMPRSSGGVITLYFTCPAGYPNRAPALAVDVDTQPTVFQSAILRRWTAQYRLVEVAREVKQYFE